MSDWKIYRGSGEPHDGIQLLPPPPPWRTFPGQVLDTLQFESEVDAYMKRFLARGAVFQASEEEVELVNAALYLRRPLLISGKPGSEKSSLAYSVAHELKLGPVLRWSITTRTTLSDGLYHYDAIGRLQDASLRNDSGESTPNIGQYIHLGPLGAALLPSDRPRVLLIDEIDKSDIDLLNDLVHIFEEGGFEIPELVRLSKEARYVEVYYGNQGNTRVRIEEGRVHCRAFPFVVLTSNEEREFPPAFLRRCLRLEMKIPDKDKLLKIIEAYLGSEVPEQYVSQLIPRLITPLQNANLNMTAEEFAEELWLSQHIDEKSGKEMVTSIERDEVEITTSASPEASPSKSARSSAFISYSHKDKKYLGELQIHLAHYVRVEQLDIWDDTKILAGSKWRKQIEQAIESAKVVVLLISANFLASDFISTQELPPLLVAAEREGVIILPVILKACAFQDSSLAQFQAVNTPSTPLATMIPAKRDEVWSKVAKLVSVALSKMQ